jgi:hypothetical protein
MDLIGMKRIFARAILAVAVISVCMAVVAKTTDAGLPRKTVVVELFTSEGCSSCPPADELLGRLRHDLSAKNIQVIPLGFHVDYWDGLGWKDRFSSANFTQRQEQYARNLKVDGPYTPEMVVDGAVEFVGNDAERAQGAIRQEAAQPEIAVVKISPAITDQLAVQVKSPVSAGEGVVMLAITEDNLATQVGAGENGGRTLHHTAVVRELRPLGKLHEGSFEATVPLKLEKEWKPADLRAIVFVQQAPSGRIEGATSVALTDQGR